MGRNVHETMPTQKNYAAWSEEKVVQFYTEERQTAQALYDSERAILEPAVEGCESLLDVGCAAGGFYPIVRAINPRLRYMGVDTVPEMIATARARHPDVPFEVRDGAELGGLDRAFDLVLCTSVLHHNPDYENMIRELYRVADRGCVMDLPRLVTTPYTFDPSTSYMVLQERFGGAGPSHQSSKTVVPYVLANARALFTFLMEGLQPRPRAIAAVGYEGMPNASVVLPIRPVCFCVVYLAKGDEATRRTKVFLDLPEHVIAQLPVASQDRVKGDRRLLRTFMTER